MSSTNYFDLFIEVAEDSKSTSGVAPPVKGDNKTVANYEYEIVANNPCKFTSDDVIFMVHAERQKIPKSQLKKEREIYFSKGRPCFRASALTKSYGWGVHSNADGKIALFAVDSKEYAQFVASADVEKKKAMRSKRK